MQHILTNYQRIKPDYIPALKLKQLRYESDTWKRLLGFMMDENVYMKNRISEILKNGFNENLLEEFENFQSSFVKEDELIGLLRNDVAELDKLLVKDTFEDGKIIRQIDEKLIRLRNNIINAERQFGKLKSAFNTYLAKNM